MYILYFTDFFCRQPPVISGLPSSITLLESETGSSTTSLYTLTVSDPEGDTFSCVISAISPTVIGFQVTAGN